jgi:hypothetical protein
MMDPGIALLIGALVFIGITVTVVVVGSILYDPSRGGR